MSRQDRYNVERELIPYVRLDDQDCWHYELETILSICFWNKIQPVLTDTTRAYLVKYHKDLAHKLRYANSIINTHNDYPAAYDEDYIQNVLSMIDDVAYVLGY
jgi:hypothetical protein